ncbi:hypothetical protein SNOG_08400 [Parastagonospora nodorum SN15]|uniref:Rhodopsin domain-containing protein n=1 Tax=Phaeosphaeria nodorum (strain SN15 / ATCC MYA-4574 / FGSC 10173) TaxID=321614 RepID=Q0UIL4_PHANO|nr:hypothetical protein SNOG_08400 [Parastagonospora nodorum SN15]EAT84676.2 hypothetical protein SNOG_08400 [Parastagonospora nodorum SN15]
MAVHDQLSVILAFVLTGLSTIIVALRDSFARVATGNLLTTWIYRLSYILDLCLIKTSILLFYNHIASARKSFHLLVRTLLAINLLGGSSMIVAAVFTCYPISDSWSFEVFEKGLHGIHATQCYNPGPFWIANATYNLVTDIVIWTLPIIFLLNLTTMSPRRRLELAAIFSFGLLAIVGSAARLRVIILWLSSFVQQAENFANLLIWSQVEQNIGIIAGSVPFLRPLFRKVLHSYRSRTRSREQASPAPGMGMGMQLIDPEQRGALPDQDAHFVVPRELVIPDPSPEDGEFKVPEEELAPIQSFKSQCSWGSAVWDGSQVRQVLPT